MDAMERDMFGDDDMLAAWEVRQMDAMERDMFGDDDEVGYRDDNHDDGTNAADGAFCSDAFASCWDKS